MPKKKKQEWVQQHKKKGMDYNSKSPQKLTMILNFENVLSIWFLKIKLGIVKISSFKKNNLDINSV